MKNSLIIAAAILIVGIIFAITIAPKPTADQIRAQSEAKIAADKASNDAYIARQEEYRKQQENKSDTIKAAEMAQESVNGAIGAYVGISLFKMLLSD